MNLRDCLKSFLEKYSNQMDEQRVKNLRINRVKSHLDMVYISSPDLSYSLEEMATLIFKAGGTFIKNDGIGVLALLTPTRFSAYCRDNNIDVFQQFSQFVTYRKKEIGREIEAKAA